MFAQRRPIFHRLLDFENELFAVVTAALDRQSLLNGNSSFAESLYGLRRSSVRGEGNSKSSLDQCSQRRSLVFLVSCCSLLANTVAAPYELSAVHLLATQVALPYLQSKMEALYNRHRQQARAPLGLRITQASSATADTIQVHLVFFE